MGLGSSKTKEPKLVHRPNESLGGIDLPQKRLRRPLCPVLLPWVLTQLCQQLATFTAETHEEACSKVRADLEVCRRELATERSAAEEKVLLLLKDRESLQRQVDDLEVSSRRNTIPRSVVGLDQGAQGHFMDTVSRGLTAPRGHLHAGVRACSPAVPSLCAAIPRFAQPGKLR